jgi:hypothetical protein
VLPRNFGARLRCLRLGLLNSREERAALGVPLARRFGQAPFEHGEPRFVPRSSFICLALGGFQSRTHRLSCAAPIAFSRSSVRLSRRRAAAAASL